MSRSRVNRIAPLLVVLALVSPLLASTANVNGSKPTSVSMDVLNTISLNGKQLKPGTYKVTADDSKVTLEQNGKVVAEAPVQWKDETDKPHYSNIVTVGDHVTEIHFSGKMRYVTITTQEGKL